MALLALAVGYAMDGFDLLILGFILSAVSAGLHLSAGQAGSQGSRAPMIAGVVKNEDIRATNIFSSAVMI